MSSKLWGSLVLGATLLFCAIVATRRFSLWVPGEAVWDYERELRFGLLAPVILVLAGVLAFAIRRIMKPPPVLSARRNALAVITISCGLSLFLMLGLAHMKNGGLNRLVILTINPAAGGYLEAAFDWQNDPRWLDSYARGMKDRQHVETHPPGAVMLAQWWLSQTKSSTAMRVAADEVLVLSQQTTLQTLAQLCSRIWKRPYGEADAAAAFLFAMTMMLAASTLPAAVYFLTRAASESGTDAGHIGASCAALLAALLPATALFAPALDLGCAAIAAWGMALAVWGARRDAPLFQVAAGVLLGIGVLFSFSMIGIAAMVAIMVVLRMSGTTYRWSRIAVHGSIFLASVALVGLAMQLYGVQWLDIWRSVRINQAAEMAHVGRSYAAWVLFNPLDFAIFLGLPIAIIAVLSLPMTFAENEAQRTLRLLLWPTLSLLVILNLMGITLGEVGRIWLPFMPPLVAAVGIALVPRHESSRFLIPLALVCQSIQLIAMGLFLNVWAF